MRYFKLALLVFSLEKAFLYLCQNDLRLHLHQNDMVVWLDVFLPLDQPIFFVAFSVWNIDFYNFDFWSFNSKPAFNLLFSSLRSSCCFSILSNRFIISRRIWLKMNLMHSFDALIRCIYSIHTFNASNECIE